MHGCVEADRLHRLRQLPFGPSDTIAEQRAPCRAPCVETGLGGLWGSLKPELPHTVMARELVFGRSTRCPNMEVIVCSIVDGP